MEINVCEGFDPIRLSLSHNLVIVTMRRQQQKEHTNINAAVWQFQIHIELDSERRTAERYQRWSEINLRLRLISTSNPKQQRWARSRDPRRRKRNVKQAFILANYSVPVILRNVSVGGKITFSFTLSLCRHVITLMKSLQSNSDISSRCRSRPSKTNT